MPELPWPLKPTTDALIRAAMDARWDWFEATMVMPRAWSIHPATIEVLDIERVANFVEERPYRLIDRARGTVRTLLGIPVVSDPSVPPGTIAVRR